MTTEQFKKYLALAAAFVIVVLREARSPQVSHPIDIAKAFANDAEEQKLLPTAEELSK